MKNMKNMEDNNNVKDVRKIEYFGNTHIGNVRDENQDNFSIVEYGDAVCLTVCDGMGGKAGGRIASSKAAEFFISTVESGLFQQGKTISQLAVQQIFADAVYHANREVFDLAVITPDLKGMGTTLTAALLLPDAVYLANIGDSRAYLVRGGRLTRLTHDDSYVQKMIDEGKMTEEEAKVSDRRHLLTRALGTKPYTEFSFDFYPLLEGDRLLLCSDGLTNFCREEEMLSILSLGTSVGDTANRLISATLDAGAPDNVTAIVVDI